MAWAISRKLVAERDDDNYVDWLERVLKREITGRDFLLRWCDGKLLSDDLNADGNAFAEHFYEDSYMEYYSKLFKLEWAETADEFCSVEDTWSNFDKLAPVLDKCFQAKMQK